MFNGDYERVKKILNTYYQSFMKKHIVKKTKNLIF